jgi:PAS domain S-box-containing protein
MAGWRSHGGRVLVCLLGALAVAAMVAAATRLSRRGDDGAVMDSTAMATLMETGRSLRADIRRVVAPAVDRTEKLAHDADLIDALRHDDPRRESAACNRAVTSSTEIDAVAVYNAAGNIVAINTDYASGKPISAERLARIPMLDRSRPDAVQSCLRNVSRHSTLEFKTSCKITPVLFDSSGLSIAYSVPIVDPDNGRPLGVVSSRVRSERVADLTAGRTAGGGGGLVEFVTDQGKYFSEPINGGRARPPIATAELAAITKPLAEDDVDYSVTRHGADYLGLFRLRGFTTLDGGGIQAMLVADEAWLSREARRSRVAQAGVLAGAGLLLGMLAILVRTVASVRRLQAGTAESVQRLDLAMDAGGMGAWDLDVTTGRLIVDDRFAAFLGVAREQLKPDQSEWLSRVHPDDVAAAQAAVADHLAGRTPVYRSEHRVRHADGSWRWNLANGRIVSRAADGSALRLVGTFADITERRATEAQLAEAQEKEASERLAASRSAGMAEVATGVLHNVGNVLNSVNVSAEQIRDHLRRDRPAGLVKAVALLDGHREDLAEFLTADARGKQLPAYLGLLARTLADEQSAVLTELESLTRGVDHIKRVVQLQQDAAKTSTFRERVRPAALLDDALRFNLTTLERHRVTVIRDAGDLPEVELDKHKTLQILVNLISNAKNAILAAGVAVGPRELTVRVAPAELDGRSAVRFTVADSGVGIAAEHMARIFTHGFTTREGGHGFGLHSAANAAREMGGRLRAASDGPGRGATFTLELPSAPVAPAVAPTRAAA